MLSERDVPKVPRYMADQLRQDGWLARRFLPHIRITRRLHPHRLIPHRPDGLRMDPVGNVAGLTAISCARAGPVQICAVGSDRVELLHRSTDNMLVIGGCAR